MQIALVLTLLKIQRCYAAEAFRNDTGFHRDNFRIDVYFWFDKK